MLKVLPLVRGRSPGEPRRVAPNPVCSFLPTFNGTQTFPHRPGPSLGLSEPPCPPSLPFCRPTVPSLLSPFLFIYFCYPLFIFFFFFFSFSCSALCTESSQSEGETPPCPGRGPGVGSACGGCLPGPLTLGLSVPPLPSPPPPWTLSDTCFWVPWANKSCPDGQHILQAAARLRGGGKQPRPRRGMRKHPGMCPGEQLQGDQRGGRGQARVSPAEAQRRAGEVGRR